jgi:hypothetical protein
MCRDVAGAIRQMVGKPVVITAEVERGASRRILGRAPLTDALNRYLCLCRKEARRDY